MKRVLSGIVLLCFMICSLGIVSFAEGVTETKNYYVETTFTGVEQGKLVSLFVFKDGYTLNDLAASTGSVFDKVYYTNMYELGASGKLNATVTIPSEALDAQCVIVCEGTMKSGVLRDYITGGEDLKIIYAALSTDGGSSSNSGTATSPYTFSKARSQALTYTAQGYDVEIALKGGKYSFYGDRIQLQNANVGTGKRITIRPATPDDKVVFTSMRRVGSKYITKVTDNEILSKVPEQSRGMIYKLDMEAAGFAVDQVVYKKDSDGVWQPSDSRRKNLSMLYDGEATSARSITPPIIYLNGKRQMLSQYPNGKTVSFDFKNSTGKNDAGNPTLSYKDSSVSSVMDFGKWPQSSLDNAFLCGFIHDSYRAAAAKITAVDTANKKITLDGTKTLFYTSDGMWFTKSYYGPRVAVVNLLEEMDIPGEYYVDSANYDIYYYAPYELTENDVIEMADDRYDSNGRYAYDQLLFIQNSENYTFDGIEFYGSRRGNAIYVTGDSNKGIEFRNCTIHATGESAVNLSGSNLVVDSCNIYDAGSAGITVSGRIAVANDVTTESKNMISNNHIYEFGMNPTFGSSVTQGVIFGRGDGGKKSINDTMKNNIIHANNFFGAMRYRGLRMKIERNEFYNLLSSVDDAGVIYTGRVLNEYGNSITENYVHDIGIIDNVRYSNMGIYWDDYVSGQTATRNIVVGPSRTSVLGIRTIGADNNITNNTFVNFGSGIRLSGRSASTFRSQYTEFGFGNYTLPASDYEHYDKMLALKTSIQSGTDTTRKFPHSALAKENLTVGCGTGINNESYTSYYKVGTQIIDNVDTDEDIFVDSANQDYRVKKSAITSTALSNVPNEENFDMDWIGPQTTLPEADQSFKLMYPANGELVSKTGLALAWEKALFADKYEYVISTDAAFSNIVESGTVKTNFVQPTTSLADGTYYWKVTAKNISRSMGKTWNSTNTGTFQVGEGMSLKVIDNQVYSADGTTKLTSLKDVKDFDVNYAVYNTTASAQDYIVFGALFSADGKFQQARVGIASNLPSKQAKTGTLEFFSSTALADGCYVRTFVFGNTKKIIPLSFFDEILKK